MTCSASNRASSSSSMPSSARSTSAVCCPRVGAGAVQHAVGAGRKAHRPRRVVLLADQRVVDGLEEAAGAHLRIVEGRVTGHHRGRGDSLPRARRVPRRPPCGWRTTRRALRASSGRGRDRSRPTRRRPDMRTRPPRPAGRATFRRSRTGSPAPRSRQSRPRRAAPRRADLRPCACGARARRRRPSAACAPTIGSTGPPGMIGGSALVSGDPRHPGELFHRLGEAAAGPATDRRARRPACAA